MSTTTSVSIHVDNREEEIEHAIGRSRNHGWVLISDQATVHVRSPEVADRIAEEFSALAEQLRNKQDANEPAEVIPQ